MSSFRRFAPISAQRSIPTGPRLSGTKSWLYGQSLISTGCKDLDTALGSGIPLGSVVVLSEELFCSQMKTFEKLFVSEGARSKQRVLIISSLPKEEVDDFLTKMPALKEVPESTKKEAPKSAFKTLESSSFQPIYPKIANVVEPTEFCHGFDLSKWEEDMSLFSSVVIVHVDNDSSFVKKVISAVHSFVSLCSKESVVGRIILDVAEIFGQNELLQMELFSRLPSLLRSSNCVLLALLLGELNGMKALRFANCIVHLQPWQDVTPPTEYRDTTSLLHVLRLPSQLSLYTNPKNIFIYGIKRTTHSLRLSELRIPPQGHSLELF